MLKISHVNQANVNALKSCFLAIFAKIKNILSNLRNIGDSIFYQYTIKA